MWPGAGFTYKHLLCEKMSFTSKCFLKHNSLPLPTALQETSFNHLQVSIHGPVSLRERFNGGWAGLGEMPATITINLLGTMTPSQGPAGLGCRVGVMKAWAHRGGSAAWPGPGAAGGDHLVGAQLPAGSGNMPIGVQYKGTTCATRHQVPSFVT